MGNLASRPAHPVTGKSLKGEELELLAQVVARHGPQLTMRLATLGTAPLSDEEREGLRDCLLAELVEADMQENGEPTERGRALDRIIGLLGSY